MIATIVIAVLFAYLLLCLVYFVLQERIIFRPLGKLYKSDNIRLASNFDEYFFEAREGGKIHSLLIHVENPKGVILYWHGNTGNLRRWATVAEEFTSFGYDVCVPDYRGFGKSKGKRTEALLHADSLQIYDWLKLRYPEKDIIIYGRSLGSGIATPLAAKRNPRQLILETPFYSLVEVALHQMPILPARLLLRFPFRSDQYITKVKCPVAIFHGTRDKTVPYKQGLALYEKIKDRKDSLMVTIPRGKHHDLNGYPLFREKLKEILLKGNLGGEENLRFPRNSESA